MKRAETKIREISAVDLGPLSPALLAELKQQRRDRETAPGSDWFVTLSSGDDRSRMSANVFHMKCSPTPLMKIFFVTLQIRRTSTPQMESSLVISKTSLQNAGALGRP
jgi:hypothetical protein